MKQVGKEAAESARKMVGDGGLPNKYWVSTSSEYLTNKGNEINCFDWAGDSYPDLPQKGETLARFDTFAEALEFAQEIYIPSPEDEWDEIHTVTIEDRLSGQVYEIGWREVWELEGRWPSVTFYLEANDDTRWVKEKLGNDFK